MQLAISWSGSSHLHLLRKKSNCSSHIVTPIMDVLFGAIHSTILLENLLSVIVVVVVVVGQTVGSISTKTLAYDCLYTLELCPASLIATS